MSSHLINNGQFSDVEDVEDENVGEIKNLRKCYQLLYFYILFFIYAIIKDVFSGVEFN